jgi:AbrB family looped-hinge helix DNA binding protein
VAIGITHSTSFIEPFAVSASGPKPRAVVRLEATPKPQARCEAKSNGKLITMTVTIDSAGRLVIPKAIREEAEIEPGTPLDIEVRNGVITIKPQHLEITFERQGRWLVARPKHPVPPLTNEIVNRTLRKIRNERGRVVRGRLRG